MNIVKMKVEKLMDSYDPITIEGYCRNCPKYEKFWSCPPFDFDVKKWLESYKYFFVIVASTRVTSKEDTMIAFDKFRLGFEKPLQELERVTKGYSMYAGSCMICEVCTRELDKECIYPERMRYSLEAVGISVSDLLKKRTGQKLTWGKDGELKTVMGLLTNDDISIDKVTRIMEVS